MSTDFAKAMRKIAEMVCSERLEQHDIPDLLVVSDMQFDQARGDHLSYMQFDQARKDHSAWDTAYEEIAQLFHEVGMRVHGRPLSPPNIIFWNVRADTYGYPAAADQKGVMLLSGYSPALMKFILSGEMGEETFWTLCLTSRGYPHEVEVEMDLKVLFGFASSQNIFCVSPASSCFSVVNLFLYTHCNVWAYQPARSSRTLPRRHVRRHVRVGHVSFNNKRLSIYDDPPKPKL
jgi:hypothetical protein